MSKDPILASLLNLLLLGTGHIYLGQTGKGILIFAIGIVLGMFVWVAAIPLIIWAMYDANKTAKKMNQSARKPLAERTK